MEIFGFKSFADRGRIEFTPGITALLGPNGCGKSNVVDAIKWVLGEQASKALRADKMEDVIFNGTESRKPLNVAEVTLTISNEKQVLALDLPEISIKRRLYRSGESEYFINNALVRLKEVRELFYDTGVGKSAYSVMEQGRIDQILSTKPEERRYLFEEAAGITKFKARGQEAERRLEKTEENLRQLEGILGEIRHTWETLKKQSEKTQVYREVKKALFLLEKDQQLFRWKGYLKQKAHTEAHIAKTHDRKTIAKTALDELNKTLETGLQDVNRLEAELVDLQKHLLTLDLGKTGLNQQQALQKERLNQYKEDASRQDSQILSLQTRKNDLDLEKTRLNTELKTLEDELVQCQKNMTEYSQALEAARFTLSDHEAAIALAEQRHTGLEAQDAQFQEDWRQVTDKLVQELDQRLKDEGFAWHKLPELTASMEAALANLKTLLKGRRDLLATLADSGTSTSESWKSKLLQVSDSLGEAQGLVTQFEADWSTYKGAVPKFLEDFLSPEGIITQKRLLEEKMALGRTEMKVQKEIIRQRQSDKVSVQQTIEAHRDTLENLRMNQVRMQTRLTATGESAARVDMELGMLEVQLSHTSAERQATTQKISACLVDMENLEKKQQDLLAQEVLGRERQSALEKELATRNQALIGRQQELKTKVEELAVVQGEVDSLQLVLVRLDTEIQAVHEHFRDKHSFELREFEADLADIENRDVDWKEAVNQKKEELRQLGQVNLMAVEEFAEVDERHQFLLGQITDLKKAREDLHRVTSEIRKESILLFSQAFEQIKDNFNTTFRRLFGGGRAELRLTEPETVLESGIEMLCQPPGKKLESINLLSGGEKSMTAVALLFATFMVRPSPFCILDEIDAALDESNVGRFVAMLTEFSSHSQFVVITHNKKTVTGASTMIGVTMESPGVSKILSVRLAPEPGEVSA